MEALRQLCCGATTSPSRLNDVLFILGNVITRYGGKALSIVNVGTDEDKTMYGSFVARKLLESASSAILARMDPARFLILQEYQQRAGAGYRAHERHPASIAWSGDIIPEKSNNTVWSNESAPDKFVRSLLGGHLAEVTWPKAIERFAQDAFDSSKSLWIEEISNTYEEKRQQAEAKLANEPIAPDDSDSLDKRNRPANSISNVGTMVLDVFRNRAQGNYSALSKGVHLEFVVDETVVLDPATVVEHMLNAVKLVSQLGFLSNYMDSVYSKIEPNAAVELLHNIEESFAK